MKQHEISEEKWKRMKEMLLQERKVQRGHPAKDTRIMLNGTIYWLNTGVPWRDLPERFGPWQSIGRFRSWTLQGVWARVLIALIAQNIVDESTLSWIVSRLMVDGLGDPLCFVLSNCYLYSYLNH